MKENKGNYFGTSKQVYFLFACLFFAQVLWASDSGEGLELEYDFKATTHFLKPPYVSTVIGDATDPLSTMGVYFHVRQNGKDLPKGSFQLKITSDNPKVASSENIVNEIDPLGLVLLKVKAKEAGYANILIEATSSRYAEQTTLYVAASNTMEGLEGYWHTGYSDASGAVNMGKGYMLVADDEQNVLSLYKQKQSGLPLMSFDYGAYCLSGEETGKEVDCEALVQSPTGEKRIYGIGSLGNGGKKYSERPSRDILFAVSYKDEVPSVVFKFEGAFQELRRKLLKWGDENGFGFSVSAATGERPKQESGFNVEGMAFAPDNATLWIGMRAPLLPVIERKKGLLIPILDFEKWFRDGHKVKNLILGRPILIDLKGRGIRDIIRVSTNKYIIVGGKSTEEKDAALFQWSGKPEESPIEIPIAGIGSLNIEAAIPLNNDMGFDGRLQLICDDGSSDFYSDANKAKNLTTGYRKFRSIVVQLNK